MSAPAPNAGMSCKEKLAIALTQAPEPWLRDFSLRGEVGSKKQLLIPSQRNKLHLRQNMEKYKPKRSFKKSRGYGKRQLIGGTWI